MSTPVLLGPPHHEGTRTAARSRPTVATSLAPLLKWPGGKRAELNRILPAMPATMDRYIEPFVGGGATFFAMPPTIPAHINDASTDLMDFYRRVQHHDRDLVGLLEQIDRWWRNIAQTTAATAGPLVHAFIATRHAADPSAATAADPDTPAASPNPAGKPAGAQDVTFEYAAATKLVTTPLADAVPSGWSDLVDAFVTAAERALPAKLLRMHRAEQRRGTPMPEADVWASVEGACKAACYTTLRTLYNRGRHRGERTPRQTAAFFALREYAYAAMFRFNARGEFNVPYGGISYNNKYLTAKVAHLSDPRVQRRLRTTSLANADFATFIEQIAPVPGDFIFLDPPYDSDFSNYDRNTFARGDHARLAEMMADLPCAFQLVIKSTPAVLDIYGNPDWNVSAFDKTYRWTIKDRNDRSATHLMVTNY